jgi:chaperonin cofactor prefoldin
VSIDELDERLELLAMEFDVYGEKLEDISDRLTILSMEVELDYEN